MTEDRSAEIAQMAKALFAYADASARLQLTRDGTTLRFIIEQPDVFDAILDEMKNPAADSDG